MKALLLALAVTSANAGEQCIEVDIDEESAEVTLYEDGRMVGRRIMLIETYREMYCGRVPMCQPPSSSGGQSTTISFSQK